VLVGLTVMLAGCPHPGAVPEDWWDTGTPPPGRADAGRTDNGVLDADLVDTAALDRADSDRASADDGGSVGDASASDGSTGVDASASPDTGTGADSATAPDSAGAVDATTPVDSAASADVGAGGDAGYQHPGNWVVPSEHGTALLQGTLDCTACHGADLTGASDAPSCDSCHSLIDPDWRTSCVFCHGGSDNATGAPPHDLSHNVMISEPGVGAHSEHLAETTHQAVACGDCHLVPTALTSPGHLLDSTPGAAEVALAGLGTGGSFDGAGCNSVYCHGNGQQAGSVVDFTSFIDTCSACHPSSTSTPTAQEAMSGDHARHLARGAACAECHAQVVNGSDAFVGPTLHVNGVPDVEVTTGAYDSSTGNCTSSCHSSASPRNWTAGAAHPVGWSNPTSHGVALLDATQDCTACHGADLTGGSSGISCDSCHAGGAAWRTDCTFCHGGSDNTTGAPPVDLHDDTARSARAVGAHTEHVTRTDHPAYSCSECHRTPTDVLSAGHLFDATPGQAELVFNSLGAGNTLSDAASATLGAAQTSCGNLYCHGDRQLDNGSVASFTSTISTCDACHPYLNSSEALWRDRMSGKHEKHLKVTDGGRVQCWECHGAVVTHDASSTIADPDLHVDGARSVQLVSGTSSVNAQGARTCSSVDCHGKDHGPTKTW
jgi:predicted CxxxxCH...CXXCH cytochrome family protein